MKVYITAPFKNGENKAEIEHLCWLIKSSWFEDFCFIRDIEHYEKIFHDAHELMLRAKEEIEKCEVLLIDYDWPASGRMIELGIAYALGKKVILITSQDMEVKETVAGVADAIIYYETLEDIVKPLSDLFVQWTTH